jgi:lipopolysaccharide heptosyltransferase I
MIDIPTPRRIALIKPSALGDIVQALPVLSALRSAYPHAHIAWIINQTYASLLHGHPELNEVLAFDRNVWRRGFFTGLTSSLRFFRLLRGRHFDLTVDLQGLLRSGLLTWATAASIRIGLASAREGAGWFYTNTIHDDREAEHAVDRYWRVAQALGVDSQPKRFVLPENSAATAYAWQVVQSLPRPWLAVSVGSRWLTKRWPPEHFRALLHRAHQSFGGSALFVGGREETALADQASHGLDMPSVNLSGATSLPQLTAFLRLADVMISNDTGPLHLAGALGKPIVAPYTCTQVRRNGPYGQEHRAIETTVSCAGSYLRQCDRLDCMRELTPARLWPVLADILQQWHNNRLSA